jgi:hypothetical protein
LSTSPRAAGRPSASTSPFTLLIHACLRPARIRNVKWLDSSFDTARRYLIPVVVGVLLAAGIAALAKFTRFDEDRSFYPTVLVIIASYYLLSAVLGGSGHALVWELVIAVAFSTAAIIGAVFSPTLVGIGILTHGLSDLVHDVIIQNPGVPTW